MELGQPHARVQRPLATQRLQAAETGDAAEALQEAIAAAAEPMTSAQILHLTFSPAAYVRVASEIVAARGVGALYMGLAFKVMHIGGTGACNAAFIPYFKKLMGIEREIF
ncbi:MAG: hypothetical protein VX017_10560, partial [Pseudomonadota bacterium]|nr:hypothetical protein [Pseudomonadota bacterium]